MFGPTAPGCYSRELITLSNPCSTDAPLALLTTGPFSVELDGGFTLGAGTTAQIPILFQPTMTGAATGTASVTSAMSVIDVPLSGSGELMPVVTETFRQPNRARSNLLVVMSDGPGMEPAQQALATGFANALQYAATAQIDFRIGVIAGRLDGGTLVGGVMTENRPNVAQQFATSVSLGSSGSPTESCVERAVQELSDGGAAWLQPRASFALLCVQNTPEAPVGSMPAALQTLWTLAGNPTRFTVNALANFEPGCPPPDDATLRGAVDGTGGALAGICPRADAGITLPAARLLGDYQDTFVLSRKTEPTSIEVSIGGVVVPPVDPNTMATTWSWDAARNAISLAPLYVPAPGEVLAVRYSPTCTP